jgi:hypothetical protein
VGICCTSERQHENACAGSMTALAQTEQDLDEKTPGGKEEDD